MLFGLEGDANASNHLLRLGMCLNLFIRVIRLEDRFESIINSIGDQPPVQRSRLQRSIARIKSSRFQEKAANTLAPFLAESIRALRLTVEQTDVGGHTGPDESLRHRAGEPDVAELEECYAFLTDLIDVTHSTGFDEAEFQVYLSLGQHIIAGLQLKTRANELVEAIKKGLDGLDTSGQLESGQSMDMIWSRTRPPTPTSFDQLERMMQIEQLAERFDKISWPLDAPLNRLAGMRQMIIQMGKVTAAGVQDTDNGVEVRLYAGDGIELCLFHTGHYEFTARVRSTTERLFRFENAIYATRIRSLTPVCSRFEQCQCQRGLETT